MNPYRWSFVLAPVLIACSGEVADETDSTAAASTGPQRDPVQCYRAKEKVLTPVHVSGKSPTLACDVEGLNVAADNGATVTKSSVRSTAGYASSAGTGYGSATGTGYGSATGTGYGSSESTSAAGYGSATGTGYGTATGTGYGTATGTGYGSTALDAAECPVPNKRFMICAD